MNEVKFTMCGIKSKITRHAKQKENLTHDKGKNESTETDPEMIQMLKLAVTNCFSIFSKTQGEIWKLF